MSAFKDQMQADMAVFFNTDEFARDVSYDDGTGPVTVQGIFDKDGSGKFQGQSATIEVRRDQVPDPLYGHTFTIDGDVWAVQKGREGGDFAWQIPVIHDERKTTWRI